MDNAPSVDPTGAPSGDREIPPWGNAGAALVLGVLVVSLLPWRVEAYYSGGSDPVVLAKASLSALALALAWCLTGWRALGRVRPRTCVLVAAYVACSLLGARASGTGLASAVLGVRVLVVLAVVALLVAATRPPELVRAAAVAFGVVGGVLVLSGLPTLLAGGQTGNNAGRLAGVLLPVSPNLLCVVLAVPALVLAHGLLRADRPSPTAVLPVGSRDLGALAGLVVLLGCTWLTGSRAGLLSLVVVLAFVVAHRRVSPWAWGAALVAVAAGACVLLVTPTVGDFFGRGGAEQLATLNSRTVAWQAALDRDSGFLGSWLGEGLAVKTVPVVQGVVDEQVLDSTWVSSYVQAGLAGLGLLATWALGTLWLAVRSRSPHRVLWTALAGYAVARSVLENGLLDTYVLFVVMLLPALSVDLEGSSSDDTDGAARAGRGVRRPPRRGRSPAARPGTAGRAGAPRSGR